MGRPASGTSPKKGRNGNKKHGRNKIKCARYRSENRREKNKARRAKRRAKDRENWLRNKEARVG